MNVNQKKEKRTIFARKYGAADDRTYRAFRAAKKECRKAAQIDKICTACYDGHAPERVRALLQKAVSHFPTRGVVLMWTRKVLRVLFLAAWMAFLLYMFSIRVY